MSAAALRLDAPVWRSQALRFHLAVPLQVCLCVIPAMAAVAVGKPRVGAALFFAILAPILGFHIVRWDPMSYGSVLLGVTPVLMVLRGVFLYSSVEVLFAAGLLLWLLAGGGDAKAVQSRQVLTLLAVSFAYWLSSFILVGNYNANFRAIELSLAAINVFLLSRHRSYLASGLISTLLSVTIYGAAIAPHVNSDSYRLGVAKIDGEHLGNPISFGLSAAMVLLLTVTDNGRWLLVGKRPWLRGAASLACVVLLLLSTSRGSWLVVVVGVAILFWYDPRQRFRIVAAFAGILIVGILLTGLGHDATLGHYLDKTFDPDQSWSKRTTGRDVMWKAIPYLLHDSPVWGFGPGSGLRTAKIYYHENLIWHSLYLQVAAETGLSGLFFVLFLMVVATHRCYTRFRITGELAPLIGMIGFWCVGITVPGLDAASACFLGFGLIGADYSHLYRIRRAAPPQAQVEAPALVAVAP